MKTRDVKVNIEDVKPIGSAGFGMPLIVIGGQEANIDYRECAEVEEVVTAGFTTSSAVYKAAELLKMQEHAPEKFAVMASTKTIAELLPDIKDKDWRQLITPGITTAELPEIARIIETTSDKMFFVSAAITGAAAMTDDALKTAADAITSGLNGYDRTVIFYYDNTDVSTPEAALVGETAGRVPGSFTYKFKTLKGLTPVSLSESKVKKLEAAGMLTYVEAAGDYITSEGKTVGGEYIDVIDGKDWTLQNIAYKVQKLKNTSAKLGYSNPDITKIENATISVLAEAFSMGIIAPTEENDSVGDYSTTFKTRAEMPASKRAERKYDGGSFTFELNGAIHETTINGTVSV